MLGKSDQKLKGSEKHKSISYTRTYHTNGGEEENRPQGGARRLMMRKESSCIDTVRVGAGADVA